MYRKGKPGIELNIENVGVEKHFYGTPQESSLDAQITSIENEYAPLVDELRAVRGTRWAISHPRIPDMVAHLGLRTRPLRQSALGMLDSMIQGVREHLSQKEVVQQALERELKREGPLRDAFRARLVESGVAPENIDPVEVAAELTPLFMPELLVQIDAHVSMVRSVLPDAMRAGHIQSMSRNLNAERRSACYAKHNWFVLRPTSPVILGDTVCLFETTGERRFKPLNDEADTIHRIYLPLASDCFLTGTPFKSCPVIDVRLLNKAIARCSYEFFVSSHALPDQSALVKGLGKWSGILSEQEVQTLIDEVRRDFLKD